MENVQEKKTQKEKKEGLKQYIDIVYIDSDNAVFFRNEGGILSLKLGDKGYDRVSLHKAIPFSLEKEYISVCDPEGNEIGIIRSLTELKPDMQKIINEELDWVYFCPVITKVYSIKEEFGYSYWEVNTESGQKRFTVRGIDAIIPLSETRFIINDVEGNRFEIADLEGLDGRSRKKIEEII